MRAFTAQAVQIAATMLLVPMLLERFGAERVGILSLVWLIVGYLSVLDFGIGVAVTRAVARAAADGDGVAIGRLFSTAVVSQSMLGTAAVGLFFAIAASGIAGFSASASPRPNEFMMTLLIAGLAIPAVLVCSVATGFLQGLERFDWTLALQAPASIFQYGLPLVLSIWSTDLTLVVGGLVASRWFFTAFSIAACLFVSPDARRWGGFQPELFKDLLRFGGWITLSALVSPLMVYLDRFLIARLVSVSAVAYYAIAVDIGMKMLVIPSALVSALLPRLSQAVRDNTATSAAITAQSLKYVLLAVGLPAAMLIAFAAEFLDLWLGPEVSHHSAPVLRIVLVGVVANAVARVAQVSLVAGGRPVVVALIQVVEAVPTLTLSYVLLNTLGLAGGAIAWSARLALEATLLLLLVVRMGSLQWSDLGARRVSAAAIVVAVYGFTISAAALLECGVATRIALGVAITAIACAATWQGILGGTERSALLSAVPFLRAGSPMRRI